MVWKLEVWPKLGPQSLVQLLTEELITPPTILVSVENSTSRVSRKTGNNNSNNNDNNSRKKKYIIYADVEKQTD
jgi:hypothetical protein